jgi:hypothetical protein
MTWVVNAATNAVYLKWQSIKGDTCLNANQSIWGTDMQ